MPAKNNDINLQDQLEQLDELLAWFEQDDFDIEAGLKKYDEGSELIKAIEARLKIVENKVTVLKQKFDE